MARKDNLRKAYEFKIGKERASKLTDGQINLLSKYYNSLSESEQSKIDNELIQGRSNDLTDMANSFIEENGDQDSSGSEDPVQQTEEKLDQELRGVSDDILKKMDELIGDYQKKVSESTNKKQPGALAVYEPNRAKEDDLVDEEIDERILTLIGQEDVTDIDYGTYKSLLREKMMVGRMTDSELATEETELLTNEFKRIKGKTGRFKVRKKKLSVDDISDMGMKPSESQPEKVNTSKLLPSSGQDDISEEVEDNKKKGKRNKTDLAEIKGFLNKVVSPALKKIDKNLTDILKTMSMQAESEEKQAEKAATAADKSKKKGREEKMESRGGQMLSGIKDKVLAPVKGIFEMIWDFVKNVLIGGFLLFILDIINNPEKFLNGIIDFFNGIIGGINDMIKGLLSPFVDAANVMINSVNMVGQGLENAFNQALGIFGQDPQDIYQEIDPIELAENPIPLIPRVEKEEEEVKTEEKEEKETPAQALATGGPVIHLNLPGHDSGGPVGKSSGINISGMGKDTQLIAAQPGEVVMSKAAVDYHGADTLLQMNVDGGGTNQPSFGTANLMGYQGGGMVGGRRSGGNSNDNVVASKDKPWWQRGMDMVGGVVNNVRSTLTPRPKTPRKRSSSPVQPKTPKKPKVVNSPMSSPSKKSKPSGSQYLMPGGKAPVYGEDHIMTEARKAGIEGKELASFMGQMSHESGNFKYDTEIGDGSRYEGSKILGNTQSGDGARYKGRGYTQLTGRWNYKHFGDKIGVDLEKNPELAAKPEVAAKIAIQFYKDRVDRDAARRGDVRGTTRGINPGLMGIEDRIQKTESYMKDSRISNPSPLPLEGISSSIKPKQKTSDIFENQLKLISPQSRVTPPGPMQRSMSISALPMGGGGSSGGSGGSSVGSNQKVAPSFSSTDPNDKHLPGVMSIYQITDVG